MDYLSGAGRQEEAQMRFARLASLANAFGYEKQKYEISKTIAEQGVVKHLQKIWANSIVVVDGLSCRHQMDAFTERATIEECNAINEAAKRSTAPYLVWF